MSAHPLTLPATVIANRHAGTWLVHALWLVFNVGAALVPVPNHMLHLLLSGFGIAFWWMLMSGHLLGTAWQMHRMLLPRVWSTLARLLLPAWIVTVLLPALAWAWLDHASVLSSMWILTMIMLGSVLLTSVPPVLMLAMLPLGIGLKIAALLGLHLDLPAWNDAMAMAAPPLLCVLVVLCWWPLFRRGAPTAQWLRPIAITLQTGTGAFSVEQMRQQQTVGWLGGNIPPALALPARHRNRAVMGVALGPAIGKPTLRALLLGHLWLVALMALWLSSSGRDADHGARVVTFFMPSIMVAMMPASALTRMWMLFRKPELGLYELALLPGQASGSTRAHDLVQQLLERMGTSTLIAIVLMSTYGALRGAPPVYFIALLGTGLASLLVNATLALWCAGRGGVHGMALGVLMVLECAAVLMASYRIIDLGQVPGWILFAWTTLMLASGVTLARLARRFGERKQPWQSRVDGGQPQWQGPALLGTGALLLASGVLPRLLNTPAAGHVTESRDALMTAIGVAGIVVILLGLKVLRRQRALAR
ncbi:hypothetical protein SAMN05428989_3485 [Pseudoxanthomonas sp. GM95]|uniref:hypothetical protein n=1 Tax=Pseudoxanthomonas sp. GM95 TaxID=1881043 RepID=UPI0008BBF932|nr:hypothetical protein [Pseudoxanthomonas sp. GM95]SEM24500.1 hypothetical protein SAMN05428989_3485 [Pseudoxanthomonas sp. GM95]